MGEEAKGIRLRFNDCMNFITTCNAAGNVQSPGILPAMRSCNLTCAQDGMVVLQAVLEFPLACGISTGTPVRVCFTFATHL